MSTEKTQSSLTLKTLLTIFIPLISTIGSINYQYVITRLEGSDKNYREIVSRLASDESNTRHAAAASIGTYLQTDGRYLDETIDILTVRLSSESNYNVRNSIIGSLKKIKNDDLKYKQIIDRLLTIDRNNFIQDYHMKTGLNLAVNTFNTLLDDLRKAEEQYKDSDRQSDLLELATIKTRANSKHAEIQILQQDYDELQFNKPMVSNMISIFLSEKKDIVMENLDFFRCTMSYLVLTDLILKNPSIKWATFYKSNLTDSSLEGAIIAQTDFSGALLSKVNFKQSQIKSSLFVNARLNEANFVESKFSDVFFIGADLADARFTQVTGLKPVYFYKAYNLHKAKFEDPNFINEVEELTDVEFKAAVSASELSNKDVEFLYEVSDNIKKNSI